jgi:predicted GIY-YIG superfamily endonuclease
MASPNMFYTYIIWSSKSEIFYVGYTEDLKKRLAEHDQGLSKATAPHRTWKLVHYSAFDNQKRAKDFELYLKSGSGKAFLYKRLVDGALKKDLEGETGIPKP